MVGEVNCMCEFGSPNDQCPIHGYEAWKKQAQETYKQEEDCPRCSGDPDGVCHHQNEDMIPADEAGEASANQKHRWG